MFDIETADWTTFVCGGILHKSGRYKLYGHRQEREMLFDLLKIHGNVWSHNGGRFDIKWALDWLVKEGLPVSVSCAGARIVSATRGKTRFLDSKALTMISLKELTSSLKVQKERLGIPCRKRPDCEPDCEGYCAISRKMPRALYKRLTDYLEADCSSLFHALQRVREYAKSADLDLSATVGGSAWKNAKRLCGLPDADLSDSNHDFAREAYFGGRVQLFRPYAPHGWECDVNSMYPSRLAFCAVPIGEHQRLEAHEARRAYKAERPGIYAAEVDVPEMHLPPLPYRHKGRSFYPFGKFDGSWTLPELRYAASLGVKVRPTDALVWSDSKILFRSWVDRLFDLRSKAPDGGKKGPLGTFVKFYLNSLTGKFGSDPIKDRLDINPEEVRGCWSKEAGDPEDCPTDCNGLRCGAHIPFSLNIYLATFRQLDPCGHVEWAAYLTSEARIEWHKQAVSVSEGMDLVYGDTDSIFSVKRRGRRMGGALGEWEDAGDFADFRGVAPKVYSYRRLGALKVKAKGLRLPKDAEAAARIIHQTRSVKTASGVIGVRSGARAGKFFSPSILERKVQVGYGDRILEPGSEVTRAPHISELDGHDLLTEAA